MEGRERWKATGRDEAAGKLRFTHLEAFWMRLRRLRAAGASRSLGRAAGRAGRAHPRSHRPSPRVRPRLGPAGARGEKLPKLPGTSVEMGGGIGRSPSPHSRPLAKAGRAPKLGVRGGNPQRLRCTSRILSESPLRWLLWGDTCRNAPVGLPPPGLLGEGRLSGSHAAQALGKARRQQGPSVPCLVTAAPFSPSPECWTHTGSDPAVSSPCGVTRVDTGSLARVGCSSQPLMIGVFTIPGPSVLPISSSAKIVAAVLLMAAPSLC